MEEEDEHLDLCTEPDLQDLDNPGLNDSEPPTRSATSTPVSVSPSLILSDSLTPPNHQNIHDPQPSRSGVEDFHSVAASLFSEETLPKRRRKTAKDQTMDATGSKDLPSMTPDVSNDNVLQPTSTTAESSKTVELSKRDKRRARQQAKKEAEANNDEHLVNYFSFCAFLPGFINAIYILAEVQCMQPRLPQ